MQITTQNRVNEHGGFFFRISRRRIDGVRLNDDGFIPAVGRRRRVERRYGSVVREAVVAANHTEAENVVFVVQNLKAFGAAAGGKAGDDVDLP